MDIAPTVLYLMGFPVPTDMPGKVLKQAIDDQYLSDHPIINIPTYETGQWKPKTITRNPEEEKQFLEKMQGLQYIDTSPGQSRSTSIHK